jgi:hypothetical protein
VEELLVVELRVAVRQLAEVVSLVLFITCIWLLRRYIYTSTCTCIH